jgi:hypothetical protein
VAESVATARDEVAGAVAALASLPPSPAGETLAAAAQHLVAGVDGQAG